MTQAHTHDIPTRLWLALARLEPLGLSPVAPGTAGSLGAVLLAPWLFAPLPLWARLAVLAAITVLGTVACHRAERALGRKDPGSVVIDELAGQWLTLAPFATLGLLDYILAFVFFRLFDIAKPPPVRQTERALPGGLGVMADDLVAGLMAAGALGIVRWLMG